MATTEQLTSVATDCVYWFNEVVASSYPSRYAHPGYEETPPGADPATYGKCDVLNSAFRDEIVARYPEEGERLTTVAGVVQLTPAQLRCLWQFMDLRLRGMLPNIGRLRRIQNTAEVLGNTALRTVIPEHVYLLRRGASLQDSLVLGIAENQDGYGLLPRIVVASHGELEAMGWKYDTRVPYQSKRQLRSLGSPSRLPQRMDDFRTNAEAAKVRLGRYLIDRHVDMAGVAWDR